MTIDECGFDDRPVIIVAPDLTLSEVLHVVVTHPEHQVFYFDPFIRSDAVGNMIFANETAMAEPDVGWWTTGDGVVLSAVDGPNLQAVTELFSEQHDVQVVTTPRHPDDERPRADELTALEDAHRPESLPDWGPDDDQADDHVEARDTAAARAIGSAELS
jgi:hypothetical protein